MSVDRGEWHIKAWSRRDRVPISGVFVRVKDGDVVEEIQVDVEVTKEAGVVVGGLVGTRQIFRGPAAENSVTAAVHDLLARMGVDPKVIRMMGV